MRHLYTIISLLLLTFFGTSCEHKDLCYTHPHTMPVKIVIDWRYAPGAEDDISTMEVMLFPKAGGEAFHYQVGKYGGIVWVPVTAYYGTCFNSGEGANRWDSRPSDFFTMNVTTRMSPDEEAMSRINAPSSRVPRTIDATDQDFLLEPDMLYSDQLNDICIELRSTLTFSDGRSTEEYTEDDLQVITFYPERRTPHYTVIIKNLRNLGYVQSLSASMSSMSGAYYVGTEHADNDRWLQSFDMQHIQGSALDIAGDFLGFGHCPDEDFLHTVTLYLVLSDGTKLYYPFDVTEQMHSEENRNSMEVTIVIDAGIVIPPPETAAGGLQPTVDGWMHEIVDLGTLQ